jgi:hypothetical protein
MASLIDRLRLGDQTLDAERRSMNEALNRLRGATETAVNTARPPARLIIGLDLTGSRAARLEEARVAMASMLDAVRNFGRIMVKAIYYRGSNECRETQNWFDDMDALSQMMLKLSCETGGTQIAEVLKRALSESEKLSAVVFIGDHCEEQFSALIYLATKLGAKSIPVFIFHECADRDEYAMKAKPLFKDLANASGGLYAEFKPDSGDALKEMLASIAAFSSGNAVAIERLALPKTAEARQLQAGLRLMLGSGNNTTQRGQ